MPDFEKINNSGISGTYGMAQFFKKESSTMATRARYRIEPIANLLKTNENEEIAKLIAREYSSLSSVPHINPQGSKGGTLCLDTIFENGFYSPYSLSVYLRQDDSFIVESLMEMYASRCGGYLFSKSIGRCGYIIHDVQGFAKELAQMGFMPSIVSDNDIVIADDKNIPTTVLGAFLHREGNETSVTSLSIKSMIPEHVEKIQAIINKYFSMPPNDSVGAITSITGVSPRGLEYRQSTLKAEEHITHPEFYPWMEGMSSSEYFQEYLDSKEKVVYFYGLPGTGKSSFVASAVANLGLSALMTANSSITSGPTFVTKLCEKLANDESVYDLVILEDADAMMRPREDGNLGLNELLSAIDGIGAMNFKLVILSNKKDTEGIDTALLRHGRAYDIMKFGRLSPTEAAEARARVGKAPKTFTHDVTLAQIMAEPSQGSMRSAQDEEVSIVAPRFPLNESKRGVTNKSL